MQTFSSLLKGLVSLSPVSDKLCRHLRTFCHSTNKTRRRDQSSGKTCRSDKKCRRDETCCSDKTCRRDETCWSDKTCRRDKKKNKKKTVTTHPLSTEVYDLSNISELLSGDFAVITLSFPFLCLSLFYFFIFYFL